ncbi:MAG: DUF11 domain-containing protein [Bifidobacteriaceae bacterium]|nr:DUF11 domain-containing protein [Bifidobacteriaceae bacterium]
MNTTEVEAAPTAPFKQVFSANANGAVLSIGNNLLTCTPTVNNCTRALEGGPYDNNYFWMHPLDADGNSGDNATTFNSSMSTLALPDGAKVLWAGLYWGARLDAGASSSGTAGDASKANQVAFRAPGTSSYQTLTGALIAQNPGQQNAYQSFKDVTDLVDAAGNGDYWVGNVQAGTGIDRYAGWALTIAYSAPGLPLRNLTVFDGFNTVGSGYPQNVEVSDFTTPLVGPVDVQLSMVVYEGDLAQTGDYALLNTTQLATAMSPGTNFFDSVNSLAGQSVTTRTPADRNMLGFDIKNLGASGIIPNGATTAQFSFSSAGDVYYPGVLALAINLYAPDFTTSTKTAVNLTSADVAKPGDIIQYTLTYNNTGQDPSVNSVACDPLPAGLDYVPGSMVLLTTPDLTVTPLPKPLPDDGSSFGRYDGQRVCVNLGRGATAAAGGTINVGDTTSFQFQGKIAATAGGTTLRNVAHLDYRTGTTRVTAEYDTPPVLTPVTVMADVKIAKTMAPAQAIAGQAGLTTLQVTNSGPNLAQGVVVTDPLPADYTVTGDINWSTTASGPNPSQSGQCAAPAAGAAVVCALPDLAPGQQVTVLINGLAASSSVATNISNVASVAATTFDPDLSNNVDTASVPMTRQADLSITKTPASATVTPGEKVTWTLKVTNQCNHSSATNPDGCLSDATGVVISDTVPDPAKLVLTKATGSPASGTSRVAVTCPATLPSPAAFQCQVAGADGRLRPGQTAEVVVEGYIMGNLTAADGPIWNRAAVTSGTFDPVQSDNLASAQVTPGTPVARIQLVKSGPATAVAGNRVDYAITATNYGPSDGSAVAIQDLFGAAGLVADSNTKVTIDRGSCSTSGATVNCTIGTLPGPSAPGAIGGVATIKVTGLLVPAGAVSGSTLTNVATMTCGGGACATPPADHPSVPSVTTNVTRAVDLAVTKTADKASIPVNEDVTYTIRVVNNGPSQADGATLQDTLPGGMSLATISVTGSSSGGGDTCQTATTTCSFSAIEPGGWREVTVVGHAGALGTLTSLTQTAVGSVADDTKPDNNTATWTHSGNPQADLQLTKTGPIGVLVAGESGIYTLTIQNRGPQTAQGVAVLDTVPNELEIESVTSDAAGANCPVTGQNVVCSLGDLASGAIAHVQIGVKAPPDLAAGTVLANLAVVGALTEDPAPENNGDLTMTLVQAETDVQVNYEIGYAVTGTYPNYSLVTSPAPNQYTGPGSVRWVKIYLFNSGPSTARDVQILSNVAITAIPDQASFPEWCSTVNQELVCNLAEFQDMPTLPPSTGLSFYFPFTIDSHTDAPATYQDCGRAPSCPDPAGGWASVTTSTPDTNHVNNFDTAGLVITGPQTDLHVAKAALNTIENADGHPAYIAGEKFGYRIDLWVPATDGGSGSPDLVAADAVDVELTDTVPPGFLITQVNTGQGSCDPVDADNPLPSIKCSLGVIKASTDADNPQKVSVYVYGTIPADASAEIDPGGGAVNTAVGTSSTPGPDGQPTSVSATAATDVIQQGDLAVSKLADSPVSYAGASVGYTVTTINNGPSTAPDAVLTDTLPLGLTFDPASSSPGCASTGADPAGRKVVTCDLGNLDPSASVNTRIVATSDPRDLRPYWCPGQDGVPGVECASVLPPADLSSEHPRDLVNQAAVRSDAVDTKTTNNTDTVTTQMRTLADIAITAGVSTNTPSAGSTLTYTLTGTNNGPSTLDNPVVVSVFPRGFVVQRVDEPYMNCAISHVGEGLDVVYTVTCTGLKATPARDSLDPGFNVPGTVTVLVPPETPQGSYTATARAYSRSPVECVDPTDPPAGAGTCESDYTNNHAQLTVNVVEVADTSIVKRLVAPIPTEPGDLATYQLTVANAGPSVAANVTVSDAVPEGLVYVSGAFDGGQGQCSAQADQDQQIIARCELGSLAPDAEMVVTLVFRVADAFLGQVCNTALVGSGALDGEIGNNTSTVCATIPPDLDVGVELTADDAQVVAGGPTSFTAVVTNHGPDGAPGTKVAFTVPAGLTDPQVVPVGASSGAPLADCTVDGAVFTCVIGDLAPGDTATYSVRGIATGVAGDSLSVVAVVTHDLSDTDPSNDSAEADVVIEAPPGPTPPGPTPPGPTPPGPTPPGPTPPGPTPPGPTPTPTGSPAVPSASSGGGGGLPFSGSNTLGMVVLAALTLLAGSALVAKSSRQKNL